jgi:hypothetical protein
VTAADLQRVVAALDAAPPRCGTTRVVAVDGRSGAGKSTFARVVAEALDAPVVPLEGLYDGWDGLERGVQRLADDVLAPLARGEDALVPRWDWEAKGWAEPRRLPARPPVLVLEGVGAGALPVAPFLSVLVWIEVPDALRRDRALTRDGDTYAPFWDAWAAQEAALLAGDDIRSRADVVIEM